MKNTLLQKLFLSTFVLVLVSVFFSPINYAQAACAPVPNAIGAQPLTISTVKPSITVHIGVGNLKGCDAASTKSTKVFVKVDGTDIKLFIFNLSDYSQKFTGKNNYQIDRDVNIFSIPALKDYRNFTIRAGLTVGNKDILDNQTETPITNISGTKDLKTAPIQSVSTEENVNESGSSGFVICGNTVDTPCNVAHLFRAFIIIINYLITMAGFVAVFFIVIAGVQMTASQGQEMHKQAIQRLSGAIIGLVLVALAFVLVNSLLAGSLNLGIRQGAIILTSPKEYINQSLNNSATPGTNSNTTAP